MKTSQKQNILRHLLYGPLCGQERDWSLGNRIPARIHELRKAGFQIEKRRCDQGHDHRTHQWEFYIEDRDIEAWCAYGCQPESLIYEGESPSHTIDGFTWFAVECSECGKGDWR